MNGGTGQPEWVPQSSRAALSALREATKVRPPIPAVLMEDLETEHHFPSPNRIALLGIRSDVR